MDSERNEGLLNKYAVTRLNDDQGKHADCRYFVLDPQHDPLAREALGAYANAAAVAGYVPLSLDLNAWLSRLGGSDASRLRGINGSAAARSTGGTKRARTVRPSRQFADEVLFGRPIVYDGRRCGDCGLVMSWWRRRKHWHHKGCRSLQRYWTRDGKPQAVVAPDGRLVGWVDQARVVRFR